MRASLLPLLLFAACQKEPAKEDTGGSSADQGPTIQDIQQGEVGEGEALTLREVYITSPLTLEGDGFFIQEPGGGEWSGIYVYTNGDLSDLDMDVGDIANISGQVSEYYDFTEFEIAGASSIDIYGMGAELTADVLDGASVTDWEPWEGCLVTLQDVTVTSNVDQYGEASTDAGIVLNDRLYAYDISSGAHCDAITGLVGYSYGQYTLNPRSADDFQGCSGGVGCPEATVAELRSDQDAWEGQCVKLVGVVATSGPTLDGKGFFVQDPGGGENSGLYVYDSSASVEVSPGQVLEIEGEVSQYYDFLEIRVSPSKVVPTGETADPVADVVDPASVSDWEAWEGALVTLEDVTVTSDMDSYGEVSLDAGIQMNDLFFSYQVSEGDHFSSITGPIQYNFSQYKICPRSEDDLVP